MRRFTFFAVAAFALLVPTFAAAQGPLTFAYRPDLRGLMVVPAPLPAGTPAITRTTNEEIARHEAMAQGYRGTRVAQAAVHCDRLIAELRRAREAQ